jgi:hypothetical protein
MSSHSFIHSLKNVCWTPDFPIWHIPSSLNGAEIHPGTLKGAFHFAKLTFSYWASSPSVTLSGQSGSRLCARQVQLHMQ